MSQGGRLPAEQLAQAFAQRQLLLHYQPLVNLNPLDPPSPWKARNTSSTSAAWSVTGASRRAPRRLLKPTPICVPVAQWHQIEAHRKPTSCRNRSISCFPLPTMVERLQLATQSFSGHKVTFPLRGVSQMGAASDIGVEIHLRQR